MILILEIAAGVVLGVLILIVLFNFANAIAWNIRDNRDWKARQRTFKSRFEHAEKAGFVYDRDSVRPIEDQLGDWERFHARVRNAEMAGFAYNQNLKMPLEEQLERWERNNAAA